MKRTIVNPHWINNARTIIEAEFHYEDGRIVTASITETDTGNPDLIEIKSIFSEEEIAANTRKKIAKLNIAREKNEQEKLAIEERKHQEELFAVKLKIFNIEAIKNSTNRKFKSQIRKSKNDIEAQVWATALLLSEFNASNTPPTSPDTNTQQE